MMNYSLDPQESNTFFSCTTTEKDRLDRTAYNSLLNSSLPCLAPVAFLDRESDLLFKYNIYHNVSLSTLFIKPMSRVQLLDLLQGLLQGFSSVLTSGFNVQYLLTDLDYLFWNDEKMTACLIYLPVQNPDAAPKKLLDVFVKVVNTVSVLDEDAVAVVEKLKQHLASTPNFFLKQFEGVLQEIAVQTASLPSTPIIPIGRPIILDDWDDVTPSQPDWDEPAETPVEITPEEETALLEHWDDEPEVTEDDLEDLAKLDEAPTEPLSSPVLDVKPLNSGAALSTWAEDAVSQPLQPATLNVKPLSGLTLIEEEPEELETCLVEDYQAPTYSFTLHCFTTGQSVTLSVPAEGEVVLGSDSINLSNMAHLESDHAMVKQIQGNYYLMDFGTLAGTKLNGRTIEKFEQLKVRHGDLIQLAGIAFEFQSK